MLKQVNTVPTHDTLFWPVIQFHNVGLEDIHLAHRLDPDAKGLRRGLPFKSAVVGVDVLGRDVERLAIHRPSRLIPSHLAALVRLTKQVGDALRHVFANFNGCYGNSDGVCIKAVRIDFYAAAQVFRCHSRNPRTPLVDADALTVGALPRNFPVKAARARRPANKMIYSLHAASNAVSHKERHPNLAR